MNWECGQSHGGRSKTAFEKALHAYSEAPIEDRNPLII